MKMVSAAKLRRAQMAISGARPYAEKLEEVTARIVGEILEGQSSLEGAKAQEFLSKLHPLLKRSTPVEGTPEKVALIVIASDRGLCGAYNTNILRFAMRRYRELQATGADIKTIYLGKRANDFFTKRDIPGRFVEDFWAGRFSTKKSDVLAAELVNQFLSGEIDRVEVCFTMFKSVLTQTAMVKQILPISVSAPAATTNEEFAAPFIYEPGRKEILATLLPSQVRTQMYRVAADSLASEFGSRMTAMDNATRNAKEMISKLSLEANRVRQANITKELLEIIGGAEALKG